MRFTRHGKGKQGSAVWVRSFYNATYVGVHAVQMADGDRNMVACIGIAIYFVDVTETLHLKELLCHRSFSKKLELV